MLTASELRTIANDKNDNGLFYDVERFWSNTVANKLRVAAELGSYSFYLPIPYLHRKKEFSSALCEYATKLGFYVAVNPHGSGINISWK